MSNFFKVALTFSCPSCRTNSTIEAAVESNSADPQEVAKESSSIPLKCAACKAVAPMGTRVAANVFPISAKEHAAWFEAHHKSLHKHIDRKPVN
jgi:hypothetical protein